MSNESKFPGYLSYPPYNLQTATAFHHHHHQQQQHQQQLTQSAAIPAHFYLSTMQVFPGSMSHIVKEEPKDEHHNDEGNNDSGVSPSHYASSESNPSIGSRSSSHGGSRPSSGNGSMQSPLNDQHQHHHQIAAYDFSSSQPMTEAPAALDLRASPTSAYAGKFEFKASPASGGQDFDYGNSPPSATAADFDCEASPTSSSAAEFDYRPSLPASSASEFVDFAAAAAAAAAATTPTALASPKESIESLKQRGKTDTLATQKVKVRRANPTLADDETRNEVACPICQFRSRKKKDIADHFLTHCSLPEDGSEEENDRRFQIQKRIISQLEQVGKPKKSKKSQKNKGQTSDVSMEADSVDYSQNTDSNDGSQIDWANEQLIEVYTPSFHANGSVKIIRCKQCPSIFICKVTFWKHMHDSHLDKEKAMKCPKCPFATQLKHHMEYHLNNHSGWKPFKCKLCDYVCVSKSMLSSHMKSHSDVHQFRCATCGYTTKYLHSLKMHLKSKPGHVQDVVLNSDGTQNPYCIIDVFGKKRGPRSKLKSVSSPATQLVPPAQQSPEQFMATSPNSSAMDTSCSPPSNPLSPYNQATFNLMLAYSNLNYSAPTPGATAPLVPFSDPQEMARLNEKLRAHMAQEYMANILRSQQHQQESLRLKNIAELVAPEMNSEPESDGPVDLRSSEESSLPSPAQQQQIQQQVTPMSRPPLARPANRRKGLAIKLSKRTVQADSDSETEDTQKKIKHGSPPPATVAPLSPPLAYNPQQSSATPNHTPEILNMTCPICPYPIPSNLFILHMSAHDPQSPLRCNKCGEVSNDGLAFYNHISLRGIDHGK